MQNREEIITELTSIAGSAITWPVAVPYRMPVGYFDGLSELIMERVLVDLPGKSNVYAVPHHYFDQLSDDILRIIRHAEVSDELHEVAPFLNTIPKKDPYHTPVLPEVNIREIIEVEKESSSGKLIAMPTKRKGLWIRYAAAAVIVGVLVTAGFIYYSNQISNSFDPDNYARIDVSTEISKLSEEELTNYLSNAEKLVIATADRESLLIDELPDVNDHLEYMSDDELNEYLQESTESTSSETVDINS
jgi:hypothetical protein